MKRVAFFVLAYLSVLGNTYAQWNLSVSVRNENGENVDDAIVSIQGTFWQAVTHKGTASFNKLPSGNYVINVSHLGFKDFTKPVDLQGHENMDVTLQTNSIVTEDVVIKGVRAENDQPVTFSLVKKEDLSKENLGQDLPYLLSMEPSVVSTSDGGTGIGYTYMRIRGLDAQKINVTINGIPYNDAESHGTYWVDIPDISSSVKSIQIQRGLGKSSNGPGAFGASINIETNQIPLKPYAVTDNSIGSYHTVKNSVQAGTGLINNHWFAEGRFSRITSDGYIDRATSNLRSYYGQAGYYSEKSLFRVIMFGGFEETYQAWYGIDSAAINSLGRTYNYAGAYSKNGIDYFYNKQVDHYNQDHVQANFIHSFNNNLSFNAIVNYTYGRGYYQEFYPDASFSDYSLNDIIQGNDTIKSSDMVGRKWLNNKLLAANTFISYNKGALNLTFGGGFSDYFNAKHYGEIIWSQVSNPGLGQDFYKNEGNKTDVNSYLKLNYKFLEKGNLYVDMNYRHINYRASGIDKENGDEIQLDLAKNYDFFNPIAGVSYMVPVVGLAYVTFGTSNREPTRADFISNSNIPGGPRPEKMNNMELGIRKMFANAFYEIGVYNMQFRDELIKTGQLDDVGYPVVRNTGKSYRRGLELNAGGNIFSLITLKGNLTLSRNKTDFKDYIDNTWYVYNDVTIAYSPGIIAGGELIVKPLKHLEIAFDNKYVGKQYLDNTQDEKRKLDPYFVSNLRLNVKKDFGPLKNVELKLLVNNLFNVKYNSNGAMYGDVPYYFPQALRNFLVGISIAI